MPCRPRIFCGAHRQHQHAAQQRRGDGLGRAADFAFDAEEDEVRFNLRRIERTQPGRVGDRPGRSPGRCGRSSARQLDAVLSSREQLPRSRHARLRAWHRQIASVRAPRARTMAIAAARTGPSRSTPRVPCLEADRHPCQSAEAHSRAGMPVATMAFHSRRASSSWHDEARASALPFANRLNHFSTG